jgi:hypothetical protein
MGEDSSGTHRKAPADFGERTHKGGPLPPDEEVGSLEPEAPRPRTRRTLVTFPIIDAAGEIVTAERRRGDRRAFGAGGQRFPVKESSGAIVITNRRRRVDRRVSLTDAVEDPRGPRLPKLLLDTGCALLELSAEGQSLRLGRAGHADLIYTPTYVSREHVCITREADRFVLYDSSRNGTHLRTEGGRDIELREASIALEGRGLLRLGRSIEDDAPDLLRYVVLQAE